MGTLAEKLQYLKDTRDAIMNAIIEKGVTMTTSETVRRYADKRKGITSVGVGGFTTGSDNGKNNIKITIEN